MHKTSMLLIPWPLLTFLKNASATATLVSSAVFLHVLPCACSLDLSLRHAAQLFLHPRR